MSESQDVDVYHLQLFLFIVVFVVELVLGTALEFRQQVVQLRPVLSVLCKLAMLASENMLVRVSIESCKKVGVSNIPRRNRQTCQRSSRNNLA